jgi:adenylate cyclase
VWHVSQNRPEDVPHARSFFNRALELDQTLAAAHTGLAILYHNESGIFAKRPIAEGLRLAADEARKAVELDPTDAEALAYRAFAVGIAGDFPRGFDYVEQALSINPNCVRAYRAKGWLLLNSGRPTEGREAILFAMRIDPRSTLDVVPQSFIVESYYMERDYESAVSSARRLMADRPDHPWPYRWMAAALGQLGRTAEARDVLDRAIATAPDAFHLFVRQRVPWVRQEHYDHMLEGLRKAGWEG